MIDRSHYIQSPVNVNWRRSVRANLQARAPIKESMRDETIKMIEIDGASLTLERTAGVADGVAVTLAERARPRIERARRFVEQIVERGEVVYGINTGFGKLADVSIPQDHLRELQINLVRSHCCGV